jgi:hypothetical protein
MMVLKLFIKKIFLYRKITKDFINHNSIFFNKVERSKNKKILLEINNMRDSHIVYSYLSNILSKIYNAEIYGFYPKHFNNFINFFIFKIKLFLKIDYFKVYSSFNVSNFIYPKNILKRKILFKTKKKIFNNLRTNDDIYDISISNINIGDLIYDAYLRKYNVPTINIKEKRFNIFVEKIIILFNYWETYFKNNEVKAVILSHTTYEFGIILRISTHLKIPTYSASSSFIYSHDKNNLTSFEMRNYKKEFSLFSHQKKRDKIEIAKKTLKQKFSGKKTIENKISLLPPNKLFGEFKRTTRVVAKSNNAKCLIAAHHFSDAPNAWGRTLFNDFFDWINFLGNLSDNLDYDWYIKFHPMDHEASINTANYFLKKFKKFNLVNPNVSHDQLISEGIDLVLTAYGTIGMEYAYHQIPVINASLNNPHISYNFNHHPKNLKEYKESIQNFKNLDIDYSKNEIAEYFYMRYFHAFYLYPDEIVNTKIELTQTPLAYSRWLGLFSKNVHNILSEKIEKFIFSKKFKLVDEQNYKI